MGKCDQCGREYDHQRMKSVADGKWNSSRYCSLACYQAAKSAEHLENAQAKAKWDSKSNDEKMMLHVKAEMANRKLWTFLAFLAVSAGVVAGLTAAKVDNVHAYWIAVGVVACLAMKFYLIIGQVARCIVIAALSSAIMAGIGLVIAATLLSDAGSVASAIAIYGCAAVGFVAGIPVGWKFRASATPEETNVADTKKTHASDWGAH